MRNFVWVEAHSSHLVHSGKVVTQVSCGGKKPLGCLDADLICRFRSENFGEAQADTAIHFLNVKEAAIGQSQFFSQLGGDDDRAALTHLKKFICHDSRISESLKI